MGLRGWRLIVSAVAGSLCVGDLVMFLTLTRSELVT